MKKIIIILFFLLFNLGAYAGTTTVVVGQAPATGLTCTNGSGDSDITSHTGHANSSTSFTTVNERGGLFTVSTTTRITAIEMWVHSESGSAYNATLTIYATSGGLPTGSALTSKSVSISASSEGAVLFVFDSPYQVNSGTYAAILTSANSAVEQHTGYDSEAGHFLWQNNGGGWNDDTSANIYIVVKGCQ